MREYLKKIRQGHQMTQKMVAEKLSISQNYLSDIENGKRQKILKLSTLEKLAEIYQVSLGVLVEAEKVFQRSKGSEVL